MIGFFSSFFKKVIITMIAFSTEQFIILMFCKLTMFREMLKEFLVKICNKIRTSENIKQ